MFFCPLILHLNHFSWNQFLVRNRGLIAVSLFLLFKAHLFLCGFTCLFSVCSALFIALWKRWLNPSRPSISTSTAFCCRLFSFTGIMWKNSGSQLKNKMSACEVLKPNLQHTLEIRNRAFKPGPMCLTGRVWNKKSPVWWRKGPFWED